MIIKKKKKKIIIIIKKKKKKKKIEFWFCTCQHVLFYYMFGNGNK